MLFSPAFLYSAAMNGHRRLLGEFGISQHFPSSMSLGELFARVYDQMRRVCRTEYLYKNEVIRQVFEARHDPDNATVLLEKPISGWASRVDMIVVNSTTTAYEIKTERDKIDRLRSQTDHSLSTFDNVVVVCSDRWVGRVAKCVDGRVGIVALSDSCELSEVRPPQANAHAVDPERVFGILRRCEYMDALRQHYGALPSMDSFNEYETCLEIFKALGPAQAHDVLLTALRKRFVRRGDRETLKGIPYELAHLYYKTSQREKASLFSLALLERSIG